MQVCAKDDPLILVSVYQSIHSKVEVVIGNWYRGKQFGGITFYRWFQILQLLTSLKRTLVDDCSFEQIEEQSPFHIITQKNWQIEFW